MHDIIVYSYCVMIFEVLIHSKYPYPISMQRVLNVVLFCNFDYYLKNLKNNNKVGLENFQMVHE